MKKLFQAIIVVLIALINTGLFFTCISYADQKVVEYGNDKNYAPFSYIENNNPTGFETDLINLIFSGNEYDLKFNMDYTWAKVEELTKSNELDICGPLVTSPQREKDMLISDVAYSRYYGAFSNIHTGEIKYSDLGNYKIGAVRGYYGEMIANNIIKANDIVLFDNFADMLNAFIEQHRKERRFQ